MRIKNDPVTNSSSTSYVIAIPNDFEVNEKTKLSSYDIDDLCDEFDCEEDEAIKKLNEKIQSYKSGASISEYEDPLIFRTLQSIIQYNKESILYIAGFDTSSDAGEIRILNISKLKNDLEKFAQ